MRKVVVVTHEQYIAQFKVLLGDGSQFGIELLEFAVQAVRALLAVGRRSCTRMRLTTICFLEGSSISRTHGHRSLSQQVAAGVADALKAAQPFVIASRMCVMLGDNIVGGVLRDAVDAFRKQGMRW